MDNFEQHLTNFRQKIRHFLQKNAFGRFILKKHDDRYHNVFSAGDIFWMDWQKAKSNIYHAFLTLGASISIAQVYMPTKEAIMSASQGKQIIAFILALIIVGSFFQLILELAIFAWLMLERLFDRVLA